MEEKQEDVPLTNRNKSGEDEYDPHVHRNIEAPTTNFESLVHILKCSLGTGILAMPQAFAKSGLVTGIIATIIIGILVTYCLHVLIKAQYALCKRKKVPLLSYTRSMEVAIQEGPKCLRKCSGAFRVMIDVFLIVYQLGICCVYIVFIAKTIKQLIDPHYEMIIEFHMLIILLPLIAFNLIRNLKLLAPWNTAANVMILVGLGIVIYFLLSGQKSGEPLDLWGSIYTFPLFFGTTLFALTAVGVVVAIENNMKTPKSFGGCFGILNIGMAFIVFLYILLGTIGYVFCVSSCQDSITLNLPQDSVLSTCIKILYAIAIFISYGLQCYVPVEIVWKSYVLPRLKETRNRLKWEYGLRMVLCLVTFVFAVAVPRLGLFISLFGALCLSALGICFPVLMQTCVKHPNDYGPGKLILIKNILIFIVGIAGLIVGTYTTLVAIILSFM